MEALILSCSTGGGHNACAKALGKEFQKQGYHTVLMDPYTLRSQKTADRVGKAYTSLVLLCPELFGAVYKLGQGYEKLESILPLPSPVLELQHNTSRLLWEYLQKHPADVIVCTHPFPGMMLTLLKRQGCALPVTVMVATDYTCIPFESQIQTDAMVIGSWDLQEEFIRSGVDPSRLLPVGIPVNSDFDKGAGKTQSRQELGLPPEDFLYLVACGSMGSEALVQYIELLLRDIQNDPHKKIVILCGNNKEFLEFLKQQNNPQLLPVSFSDRMDLYMAAADMIITKPGGLSITEACASGIPLLLISPIPGCESKNACFMEKKQTALYARNVKDFLALVKKLESPSEASAMKKNQKENLPHNSAQNLVCWCTRTLQEKHPVKVLNKQQAPLTLC